MSRILSRRAAVETEYETNFSATVEDFFTAAYKLFGAENIMYLAENFNLKKGDK